MYGLDRMAKHMKDKHPNSKNWGDSCCGDLKTGKIISQKCFLCREELVKDEKTEEIVG